MNNERLEVDAWTARYNELVREHMARGMTKDQADDRATRIIRREIRGRTHNPDERVK